MTEKAGVQGVLQATFLLNKLAETARRSLPFPLLNDGGQLKRRAFRTCITGEKINICMYSDTTVPAAAIVK